MSTKIKVVLTTEIIEHDALAISFQMKTHGYNTSIEKVKLENLEKEVYRVFIGGIETVEDANDIIKEIKEKYISFNPYIE